MTKTNFKPVRKAVFPVAGLGTRFLPATKVMPKEMLPINDRPLIQHVFEEAREAGIEEFIFVTGRHKTLLEEHFDYQPELEQTLESRGKTAMLEKVRDSEMPEGKLFLTRQAKPLGLGHAIWCAKSLIGDEPFGVVLSDDLCLAEEDGVMAQMVKLYKQFRCSIVAIQEVPDDLIHKFGVIKGEQIKDGLFQVSDMVEKPKAEDAPSNLAIIGRYILTPDIFDIIEDTPPGVNGEVQLTDALLTQARNGCVLAYKFKGRRFDCGSVEGFVEATNYVYENIYKA